MVLQEEKAPFLRQGQSLPEAPVEPPNIIGIALNYHDSLRKREIEPPPEPVVFFKSISSTVGHLQPVVLPAEAPHMVEYEAELAVVIGKKCRRVSRAGSVMYFRVYLRQRFRRPRLPLETR